MRAASTMSNMLSVFPAASLARHACEKNIHGKPFDRVVQFTDTLIKRDGHWQLAAAHVLRIEK
jgi:hypothetical protein